MEFASAKKVEVVDIQIVEAVSWPVVPRPASQYDLVYVLAGQGHYTSGQQQYSYQPGDLFLLRPNYVNRFYGSELTRFCVVTISMSLLREAHTVFGEIIPVFAQSGFRGSPTLTAEDKAYVGQQLAFCLREHNQQLFGDHLVRASLISVLLVLRRAHIQLDPTLVLAASAPEELLSAILAYVRQHLKEPHRLRVAAIGAHFHQRPRYVGQYVRQHLGRSLKQLVLESQVLALQQELRFTDKTISQLAFDYGFADESHLGKVFKDIAHQTPMHYRRTWQSAQISILPRLAWGVKVA